MAAKKKATTRKKATTKKGPRPGKEIQLLAAQVKDVHEIDLDAAITLLAQKDEAKPGTPNYSLVVAAFGREVAKAVFGETRPKKARETKAKSKKPRAPKAKKPAAERKRTYTAQTITRTYKGTEYKVKLAADGTCVCDGTKYSSLTACALEITGYGPRGKRISGPAFFGLTKAKKPAAKK